MSVTTNNTRSARTPAGVPSVIQHYIGGKQVDSVDGGVLDVLHRGHHTASGRGASGTPAHVDAAVAAARDAFENSGWADMPSRTRSDALRAIAAEIEKRNDIISSFEAFDTGLPVTQAYRPAQKSAPNASARTNPPGWI